MRGFDISFLGSSLISAYWNGAATYYRGLIRSLHERGHRVTFYEPDAYERRQHRDIPDPGWARVVVYEPQWKTAHRMLRQAADESDVLVKASGVGVLDRELEMGMLDEQRPGQIVIFWDVDAPVTLDRVLNDPTDAFASLISQYDAILTYGGGTPVIVLNISRHSMAQYGYSPATRLFEAAGAGACMISDAWEGIDRFIEPDKEILVAESGEQVLGYLEELTETQGRRIGLAARRRVLAEHTYAHRAEQVEQTLAKL
ncbi:MAG TPA: hypothetical protein DCZ95_06410 [Verrucomicrobia bacterium]|nr:MAG: hypothetical protein A2X46_16255 [Lentisphaerae bacterium GWF2_57_35]HBA83710.1 hypothetical protein [Verrucomicrobiota bacterium]